MAKIPPADLDITLRGSIKSGKEVYHPLLLFGDIKYTIELAADDEDVDLDLYITDQDGTIIYQDESAESGASAWFQPSENGIYHIFVKSASGNTTYELTITE